MGPEEILDGLPDGVVVVASDRTVLFMNRMAERMSGWTREAAVGRRYGEVIPLRDGSGALVHERADPFDDGARVATGLPEREYLLRRPDGTERWVAVRAAYARGARGRVERVVLTLRDAGRKRRLERAGADLISTVAHEIRSPLTSVKGFTSTLLHRWERFRDRKSVV